MKPVALGLIGIGMLTAAWKGVSALTKNTPVATPPTVSTPQSLSIASTPQGVASSPNVAQETCGDPSNPTADWYGVFVDGGDLSEMQSKFCRDAVAVVRQDSARAAIQVASFTNPQSAANFARIVGGTVAKYNPNQKKSTVGTTSKYSLESLDATFLEIQNKTPGFSDTTQSRQMIGSLAISYCENHKKGVSDEKLLGQALKAIMQTDSTDEMKIMSSVLAGTIIYAAKTHLCP